MVSSWLKHHPMLRNLARGLVAPFRKGAASSNYVLIPENDIQETAQELDAAWKDATLPERQRQLVDSQLKEYRAGKGNILFDGLVQAIKQADLPPNAKLLEIGCSSGYYAEVLASRNARVDYRGCDFSPLFIDLARKCYPTVQFDVQDARSLSYGSAEFDVVVSGCCLLHIFEYEKAIAEAARVARKYVVFHRTPVLHHSRTRFFTKEAYGV